MASFSAKAVKKKIATIRSYIEDIKKEVANKDLPIKYISKDVFLAFYPEMTKFTVYLEGIGIQWEELDNDVNGLGIPAAPKVCPEKESKPLTGKSSSEQVKDRIKALSTKVRALSKELKSSDADGCYISKDVFLTLYPECVTDVEHLCGIGVPWSHLLAISGLDYYNFYSKDVKKTAAMAFKHLGEVFSFTKEHLLLLQKLLIMMNSENPQRLTMLVKSSLNYTDFDDKKMRSLIGSISSFVQYLQLIE